MADVQDPAKPIPPAAITLDANEAVAAVAYRLNVLFAIYPITEYLSRVRVEKAKSLLLSPHARVSEVAFEVGFQSLSQFNRVFKRITGLSPSEDRTRLPKTPPVSALARR